MAEEEIPIEPDDTGAEADEEVAELIAEDERLTEESKTTQGRPRKSVNWELAQYLSNMGATTGEICAACNISPDSMLRGHRGKVFAAILAGGVYRANISIRRVLFGTLRGRLIDPATGEVYVVPMEERIAMAKYLSQRKTYLNLEAASTDVTSGGKSLERNVVVIRVGADDDDVPEG